MRILFSNNAPIIKYGIGQAFSDLGYEVCYINILFDANWIRVVEDFNPDFIFTDGGWGVYEQLTPQLRRLGIPHIYWAIEDPPFFDSLSMPFARQSQLVFTTCRESISLYKQYGIEAHLLMFACHPHFHYGADSEQRFQYDIVFVGNNYDIFPERITGAQNILAPLMENGYKIKIFGNDWWMDKTRSFFIDSSFYGGQFFIEDLPVMCASVPIVLGLHSVINSSTMMSMRTFEVLGCRGFHITQWTPAIENTFRNHHHLVWTKSPEETLDLVDYYLSRPEARDRIARQGQNEVYEKHTYIHRAREIQKQIESISNWLPYSLAAKNTAMTKVLPRKVLKIYPGQLK